MTWENRTLHDHHWGKHHNRIGSSDVRNFLRSAKYMKSSRESEGEPTPAMQFGTNFHEYLLEGPDRLVVMPKFDRRTKVGKADYAEWIEANNDKTSVSQKDLDAIKAMTDSVLNHKIAGPLINISTRETTGLFEFDGIPCKIRPDIIDIDNNMIVDIKTTTDASEESFTKTIFNFGYHIQAAFYTIGARMIERKEFSFIIVAVEKSPPYDVNCFHIQGEAITLGIEAVVETMPKIGACMALNQWPGYEQALHTVSVPGWVK